MAHLAVGEMALRANVMNDDVRQRELVAVMSKIKGD
jgi:hypothetical protein